MNKQKYKSGNANGDHGARLNPFSMPSLNYSKENQGWKPPY